MKPGKDRRLIMAIISVVIGFWFAGAGFSAFLRAVRHDIRVTLFLFGFTLFCIGVIHLLRRAVWKSIKTVRWPEFSRKPLWVQPTPADTRALWKMILIIHVFMLFLFGLLPDDGGIRYPGCAYSLTVIVYLTIRFTVARFKGYPLLSKGQALALLLLPVYGPVIGIALFHWVQRIRWGI